MGCTGSKLEDLEAIALCRGRSQLLEFAIRHRYSFAHAHLAYLHSLTSVGVSLNRFFDLENLSPSQPSPHLPLPTQRKADPDPTLPFPPSPLQSHIPVVHHHSRSDSGSHIHFHSDSGSESSISSPLHDHVHGYGPNADETLIPTPPNYYMNYMQSQPSVPSVAYQQRPQSTETVRVEEDSFGYHNPNPSSYSYPYAYSSGFGGFFGSSSAEAPPPAYYYPSSSSSYPPPPGMTAAVADSSVSRAPPPPPSPPRTSPWDFLNPFETFERYYPQYTPSRDSKELREEEGIPDLEDEDSPHELVKEVDGEQKFALNSKKMADEGEADKGMAGVAKYQVRSSVEGEKGGVEYEVHLVDKNVVGNEEDGHPVSKGRGSRPVADVVREIKAQFDRASESGNEVSKILEVGKLPYRGKNAVYKVPSKMLDLIATPLSVVHSQPSSSKNAESSSAEKDGSLPLDFDKDMGMKSRNLSSTLEKLYIWEKKLYEEVKAEEKLRILHERKCRRLKHLDERGAEAHKVESTQTLVRKLATKIRIAIQVVNSISSKIDKLRDEELWPQINELIQGLVRMWKVMLECHRSQCQVISEAKNLDGIASGGKLIDDHMKATMELELELLNWLLNFYAWISAQKGYIKSLNGWLLKCLHSEPEETADGIAPFSPGRIGAPPVFVICNHWSQAIERISENEVFVAMQTFSTSVLQLWEQYVMEQRQRMMGNKDMERGLKSLERDEQKMQKTLDSVNKKLLMVSEQSGFPLPGQIVQHSGTANVASLQLGLKQIFEALEKFSEESMKAYEELWIRSEEQLARESAKVS